MKVASKKEKISGKNIIYHKDGSIWAKGKMKNGVCDGYWEWFRKDGKKMRAGYFKMGKQVRKWATYDKKGSVYKVTNFGN
jgi:antitoxin component YwqK of YwqJK toxin-antitoxin module